MEPPPPRWRAASVAVLLLAIFSHSDVKAGIPQAVTREQICTVNGAYDQNDPRRIQCKDTILGTVRISNKEKFSFNVTQSTIDSRDKTYADVGNVGFLVTITKTPVTISLPLEYIKSCPRTELPWYSMLRIGDGKEWSFSVEVKLRWWTPPRALELVSQTLYDQCEAGKEVGTVPLDRDCEREKHERLGITDRIYTLNYTTPEIFDPEFDIRLSLESDGTLKEVTNVLAGKFLFIPSWPPEHPWVKESKLEYGCSTESDPAEWGVTEDDPHLWRLCQQGSVYCNTKSCLKHAVILDKDYVSVTGYECDKVGTGLDRWGDMRGEFCYLLPGSCITGQLRKFKEVDRLRIEQNLAPLYALKREFGGFPRYAPDPMNATSLSSAGTRHYLGYDFGEQHYSDIRFEMDANDVTWLRATSPGHITFIEVPQLDACASSSIGGCPLKAYVWNSAVVDMCVSSTTHPATMAHLLNTVVRSGNEDAAFAVEVPFCIDSDTKERTIDVNPITPIRTTVPADETVVFTLTFRTLSSSGLSVTCFMKLYDAQHLMLDQQTFNVTTRDAQEMVFLPYESVGEVHVNKTYLEDKDGLSNFERFFGISRPSGGSVCPCSWYNGVCLLFRCAMNLKKKIRSPEAAGNAKRLKMPKVKIIGKRKAQKTPTLEKMPETSTSQSHDTRPRNTNAKQPQRRLLAGAFTKAAAGATAVASFGRRKGKKRKEEDTDVAAHPTAAQSCSDETTKGTRNNAKKSEKENTTETSLFAGQAARHAGKLSKKEKRDLRKQTKKQRKKEYRQQAATGIPENGAGEAGANVPQKDRRKMPNKSEVDWPQSSPADPHDNDASTSEVTKSNRPIKKDQREAERRRRQQAFTIAKEGVSQEKAEGNGWDTHRTYSEPDQPHVPTAAVSLGEHDKNTTQHGRSQVPDRVAVREGDNSQKHLETELDGQQRRHPGKAGSDSPPTKDGEDNTGLIRRQKPVKMKEEGIEATAKERPKVRVVGVAGKMKKLLKKQRGHGADQDGSEEAGCEAESREREDALNKQASKTKGKNEKPSKKKQQTQADAKTDNEEEGQDEEEDESYTLKEKDGGDTPPTTRRALTTAVANRPETLDEKYTEASFSTLPSVEIEEHEETRMGETNPRYCSSMR
ncbi:hypothetical protein NCLIV_014480 [Neospora caninum Liverpool]|uniref:Generative cell specific-1/HAP2 domain-containing protein n=1 Tax=Neospora caninum (strain Liverpool) TaxID=572307 RepID=F0VDD9_NEOCL|nr:hypothetical protein NCLIV_014480 [Neospora caninum Liverpool]CBZ51654.1 hypothetical protein NCLIV_014480 [Neospora caninum Liverpool]|eukprot:XP_003881687.1 hypothetical protein NCLIV_014480 [Neospora caninum Liverpool]